jgi:hypothetical protein
VFANSKKPLARAACGPLAGKKSLSLHFNVFWLPDLEVGMCQQWFAMVGLTAEVIGFLMIAYEWHETFKHLVLSRDNAVELDYIRTTQGEEAAKAREEADASMWRNTQRENHRDNAHKMRLFGWGVALVIFGYLGQLIGSLPYAFSVFHFTSCS